MEPSDLALGRLCNAIDTAKQVGVYSPDLLLPERVEDAIALLTALVAAHQPTKISRWTA